MWEIKIDFIDLRFCKERPIFKIEVIESKRLCRDLFNVGRNLLHKGRTFFKATHCLRHFWKTRLIFFKAVEECFNLKSRETVA